MTLLVSPPRIVGYARVSTVRQDVAYQLRRLRQGGCVQIFQEKRTGTTTDDRPQLHALLGSLQTGDVVLATAVDRVARDPLDFLNILKAVKQAGASLRLLDEPFIDTTSEMADLIAFLSGWATRWHWRRLLENTAQGRELAQQRGVKFGRKPKLSPAQRQEVSQRRASGEPIAAIARAFNVSQSTIFRVRSKAG